MKARTIKLHAKTREKLKKLKAESARASEYRVSKRIHAVLLCAKGKTSGEIADLIDSPRSCVTEWLRNYEEQGFEGLLEGHRCGRESRLSAQDKTRLADIIESGPVAYGLLSGIWTSPMIAKIIQDEFSVEYHPAHVRKLLYAIGFSVQRPKKILAKADPDKQNKWRRYTYPNIKKKQKVQMPC